MLHYERDWSKITNNEALIIQNTNSKVYTLSIKKDADYKLKIIENSFNGLIIKV